MLVTYDVNVETITRRRGLRRVACALIWSASAAIGVWM